MAELTEEGLARVLARILDERDLGGHSSSGYRRRNRFEDDYSGEEGYRGFNESNWEQNNTKLQQGFNSFLGSASKIAGAIEGVVNHIKNIDRELMGLAQNWANVDDAAAGEYL